MALTKVTGGLLGNLPTGTGNVAVGDTALDSIESGAQYNVAIGSAAGTAITTGAVNTLIGALAGDALTSGNSNVAVGYQTLSSDTLGDRNVAVGVQALQNQNFTSTTDSYNTAVGFYAGLNVTTGVQNTLIGASTGDALTTGSQCTFIGMNAGGAATTGTFNAFLGRSSGSGMTTGSKNTIIGSYNGNQGSLDIRTSSNNIVLSDGDGNPRAYYHGGLSSPTWFFNTPTQNQWAMNVQNTTTTTGAYGLNVNFTAAIPNNTSAKFITCQDGNAERLIIYSNGNVVNVNNSYDGISDVKLKENIVDSGSQWDDIKALRVRKYSLKEQNASEPTQIGVIAQEVEAAGMSGLVTESPDRDAENNDLGTVTKAVQYSVLYMKAVKALQEAMDRIETLEAKVAALES